MDKILKSLLSVKSGTDVNTDIQIINQYAQKELRPEDVFMFSVILCGNEIDRDYDQFTNPCLDALAKLFLGKTGIYNLSWNAKDQVARIYRASVESGAGNNAIGEQSRQIRASAYIPRDTWSAEAISKIETGILKEVSVGVAVKDSSCSICGKSMKWWGECEDGHRKGLRYETGGLCFAKLENAVDAYEFSFVVVPAQRAAGVTKCCGKCSAGDQKPECPNRVEDQIGQALQTLSSSDLSGYGVEVKALETQILKAQMSKDEQEKRAKIIEENKHFLGGKTQ